jgi:hypothetical protein
MAVIRSRSDLKNRHTIGIREERNDDRSEHGVASSILP